MWKLYLVLVAVPIQIIKRFGEILLCDRLKPVGTNFLDHQTTIEKVFFCLRLEF